MPPPLEQTLVNQFKIPYRDARCIVSAVREELGLPSRGPWTQELYDACVLRIPGQQQQEPVKESRKAACEPQDHSHHHIQESSTHSRFCHHQQRVEPPTPVNRSKFQQPSRVLASFRSCSSTALESFRSVCSSLSGEGCFLLSRGKSSETPELQDEDVSPAVEAGKQQQQRPVIRRKDRAQSCMGMKREQEPLFPSAYHVPRRLSVAGRAPTKKKRGGSRRLIPLDRDDDDDYDETSFSTEHSEDSPTLFHPTTYITRQH